MGELAALLVTSRFPVASPVPDGANVTVTIVESAGANDVPGEGPCALNSACVVMAPDRTIGWLPVFTSVATCDALLPSGTELNPKADGRAVSRREAASPTPLSAMEMVGFVPVASSVAVPDAGPLDCGVNWNVMLMVAPGETVTGSAGAAAAKPVPVTMTCERVTAPDPTFCATTTAVFRVPTTALPKLSDVEPVVSSPEDCC